MYVQTPVISAANSSTISRRRLQSELAGTLDDLTFALAELEREDLQIEGARNLARFAMQMAERAKKLAATLAEEPRAKIIPGVKRCQVL